MSQLAQAPEPSESQLHQLQKWLRNSRGGGSFLKGWEHWTWEEDDVSAYVSLNSPAVETDAFTDFLTYRFSWLFRFLFGRRLHAGKVIDEEAGLTSYSDSKLNTASRAIAIVISSIMPVLTIFVIHSLGSTTTKIGMTVFFTAVFAILLALFSSANRAEIFVATAT